jgi:hypothetical protein
MAGAPATSPERHSTGPVVSLSKEYRLTGMVA